MLNTLDDQTQVDSKPAGQPEQVSLNQCQLIAQNWCSVHGDGGDQDADGGDQVSL